MVWLVGHGFDRDDPAEPMSSADHALQALRTLAAADLGLDGVAAMSLGEVRAAIQGWFRDKGPVLWVVDDLADDADTDAWTAPMDDAATIFTTRVRTYDGLFEPLRLDELSPADAVQLLTRDHPPATPEQQAAAATIAERLGRHALALDVTRCRVRSVDDYEPLLQRLDERTMATLDRAATSANSPSTTAHRSLPPCRAASTISTTTAARCSTSAPCSTRSHFRRTR